MTVVLAALLAAIGAAIAGLELLSPTPHIKVMLQLALGGLAGAILLWAGRRARAGGPAIPLGATIAITEVACVVLAYLCASVWPNSGDEYGYLYLARTLEHGRVFNPPPPVDGGLFDMFWIGVHDGRSASQYAPGWSAILLPFDLAGIAPLANPALTALLGFLLAATLARLGAARPVIAALVALVMLSPFVLFNGASLFNHTLSAVEVMTIVWLQLRDETQPRLWQRVLIGFIFSLALVTRHEVFAVVFVLFVVDRLARRRLAFIGDAIPMALGALPVVVAFLAYNWAITGNPFLLTLNWAAPGEVAFGFRGLPYVVANEATEFGALFAFGGAALLALYLVALWQRIVSGRLRFFDVLFPALVLFMLFYMRAAGHQYGPRYWFAAWPTVALTIGAARAQADAAGSPARIDLPALARLHLPFFLGFAVVFALYLRLYVDARRAVLATDIPRTPAVLLIPDRTLRLVPYQRIPFEAPAKDFTRNGVDFTGPVLFARDDVPNAAALACTLPDRSVWRWTPPGQAVPVACPP
jgi:hypothetical protein